MLADLRAAFAFLTILPVGYAEPRRPGHLFAWFPLVGGLIGLVLWGVALIPWPVTQVSALAVLVAWVLLTGGLHLDGFGDSCDGLLAMVTPERRLEIMKDPRTGTWAVVGLLLLLLGKYVLIGAVAPVWLLVAPVIGRTAMVLAAYSFPHARTAGLGVYYRDGLGWNQLVAALLFTVVILAAAGWLLELRLLLAPGLLLLTVWAFGRWAAARLGGGLTGDIYGAICELTEVGCLLLALFFAPM